VSTATILARHRRGEISASMALAAMLVAERDLTALRLAIESAGASDLRRLLDQHAAGTAQALAILRQHDQGAIREGIDQVRHLFDSAVAVNPAASVALYSLGDESLLATATDEVVSLLDRLGILGPDRRLLDFGCGIGRFEQALSPLVGIVTGIDISPGMIEAAGTRCAGLANVRHHLTSGRDLAQFLPGSFDAVIAIDSFPYLYEAGGPELVRTQLREIDRVLRAPGDIVIMNLSYRGDLTLDRSDAGAFSTELGFELLRDGTSDLRSWDGTTFHLRKRA
jgi:cyclopropane fatty-acyl-phospholipid synthase-like methyltransferase